jgi:hypothetical protein
MFLEGKIDGLQQVLGTEGYRLVFEGKSVIGREVLKRKKV